MQPPRRRSGRINLRTAATGRAVTLNATAVLLTVTFVRLSILLVPSAGEVLFANFIRQVTDPLVWPLHQLSVMSASVVRQVTLADLLLVPIFLLVGLLAAGVISGWGQAASPRPPHLRTRS